MRISISKADACSCDACLRQRTCINYEEVSYSSAKQFVGERDIGVVEVGGEDGTNVEQ